MRIISIPVACYAETLLSVGKVPDRDGNQAVQSKRLAKNPSPLDVPTSLRDPWVQFMRQEYIPSNIRDHLYVIDTS